jgi:hypothetical protein
MIPVLRWPKNYYLLDEQGQLRKPGAISKGKRSWKHRLLWDARLVVIARLAFLLSPSQILLITNPSGLSLPDARDNPLGICSPVNQPTRLNSLGKSFWLMPSCFPCSHQLG